MEIKEGSFADGIRKLNTKGALVIPTRLTKARARILLDYIPVFKHKWYCEHNEKGHPGEDDMQNAMQWLANQINKRWSQNELYSPRKKKIKKVV